MKVQVNSKKKILKSFLGWFPLALGAALLYCALFGVIIMWLSQNYFGFTEVESRSFALPCSAVLVLIGIGFYLNWITSMLSSFELEIDDEILIVKGKGGWKTIDTKLPINEIKGIYIGNNPNTLEKLSGHGVIEDQVASRLTVACNSSPNFYIDFALKAFDHDSLLLFFKAIISKGIDTNVNV